MINTKKNAWELEIMPKNLSKHKYTIGFDLSNVNLVLFQNISKETTGPVIIIKEKIIPLLYYGQRK